jgi:hypothetical protein
MADSNPNKENIPPVEDVWAAARRRLMEGQVWYVPLSSLKNNLNDNPWNRKPPPKTT